MAQQKEDGKWRATVSKAIPASIEKVWAVLADFDGLQRNFPEFFLSCETVEGEKNQVGSLRVVKAPISGNVIEGRERLLTNDEGSHTISYATEHIGLGWTGYKAFITAESVESGLTIVNWSFELDPLSTMTHEKYIQLQTDFIREVLQIVTKIVS